MVRDSQARRHSSVYGNLAYELDREPRRREPRHTSEPPLQRPVSTPQIRTIFKPQVREREKISLLAVFGFVTVIALAVLVLACYVQMTMLSTSVVELKSQFTDLETKNVTLTTEYEKMYDLSTVKEAAEAEGMAKPTSSQIYYIDLSDGDSAVVYQGSAANVLKRLLVSMHQGVYAVVEYFD